MKLIILTALLFGLISCDEMTQTNSESRTIILPASKPSNFETNDSSFLKIEIQDESYQILFLKRIFTVKSINALDNFLMENKGLVNKEKVIVTGFENNEKQKDFKALLLKYGISKFRVNTK